MSVINKYMALVLSSMLLTAGNNVDFCCLFNTLNNFVPGQETSFTFISKSKISFEVPLNQPERVTALVKNLPAASQFRKDNGYSIPGIFLITDIAPGLFRNYADYPEVICLNFTQEDIIFPFHNFI